MNKFRFLVVVSTILVVISIFHVDIFASSGSDHEDIQKLIDETYQYLDETEELTQDVDTNVLRISSNDTSGLHSIILSLIGDYNPIVKDYVYTSNNGYQSHSIEITPDWSWIASAAIFALVLFCVFRFIGGLFSHD